MWSSGVPGRGWMTRSMFSPPPVGAAIAYSAGGPLALLKLVGLVMPLRTADSREEGLGLDVGQHGEEAYTTGEGAILVLTEPTSLNPEPTPEPAGGRA